MLKFIKSLLSITESSFPLSEEEKFRRSAVTEHDFGNGFEARELETGEWILWDKSRRAACDLKSKFEDYRWRADSVHYKDCIASKRDIFEQSIKFFQNRGKPVCCAKFKNPKFNIET